MYPRLQEREEERGGESKRNKKIQASESDVKDKDAGAIKK